MSELLASLMTAYDGRDHRFRNNDASSETGRELVAAILGVDSGSLTVDAKYDLNFYTGGIGADDRHAIRIRPDAAIWDAVIRRLKADGPENLSRVPFWGEGFLGLIDSGNDVSLIDAKARGFVNGERRPFQAECREDSRLLFGACSDVNGWSVLWGSVFSLNYLAFSQG